MTDITNRAMLVTLKISQWTAKKHDRKITSQVHASHGAAEDSGRYNKSLVAKTALAGIVTAAGAARTFHYENTLPWLDDGARILPAANYFAYTERMRALRAEFESECRMFVLAYPDYVAEARRHLNGLFNAADYPAADDIAKRFRFESGFSPMPSARDFRVDLGAEHEAQIRAEIEARAEQAITGAVRDAWSRVHDVASKMAERLRAYTVMPDGKIEAPFRDTLVENVRDLAALLPRLNLTGDAALDRAAETLATKLGAYDAQELRDDGVKRAQVASEAEKILASMAGYFGDDAPADNLQLLAA